MTSFSMYVLTAIAVVFGLWWQFSAPCSTIIKWSWTLKDVPVRCLYDAL